jgi:SH3 domain-containing YSC84-like protein 1
VCFLIDSFAVIWNANQVLSWVLDPKTGGVNPELFGPSLLGIAIINVVEAGFVFSGNVGTGIVIARDGGEGSNKWSPPSAIGLTGIGFGLMIG